MDNGDRIMLLIAILIGIMPALLLIIGLIFILWQDTTQARDIIFVSDNIKVALMP